MFRPIRKTVCVVGLVNLSVASDIGRLAGSIAGEVREKAVELGSLCWEWISMLFNMDLALPARCSGTST